jgi:hypothetical protein
METHRVVRSGAGGRLGTARSVWAPQATHDSETDGVTWPRMGAEWGGSLAPLFHGQPARRRPAVLLFRGA